MPKLEQAREELKRLGYLHEDFERSLLQDALRPQRPLPVVARLAARLGLAAGGVLALAAALALALANGSLTASPLDLPVLFLHLFPPIAALAAVLFLLLSGLLIAVLRLYPVRRVEGLALAVALVAGLSALGGALWAARVRLPELRTFEMVLLGLVAPAAALVLVRLVYQGLLGLAVRFTGARPGPLRLSRRRLGWGFLAVALALVLPAVWAADRQGAGPAPAASLPKAPGDKVLLLGIDGVLPREIDYLLALGDLPAMGGLARSGGRLLSYARQDEPPASFWTTVATGRPGPAHGVVAVDSFRPLGVETPLGRNGPLRAWWSRVAVPLGLAEYRPLLANRRSAPTFWELASRGGAPVAAINWWATFPAEPLPGRVVAHGAFQLLSEGADGAVEPAALRPGLLALVARARAAGPDPRLRAALPGAGAAAVWERALAPDLFYRDLAASGLAAHPEATALYLPALDIAADGFTGGDVALADLVRQELGAADRLLARALADPAGPGTIAVVFDPGRRERLGGGRVLLWRRAGCVGTGGNGAGGADDTTPEAVAAGLLRALGLPQSAELPPPPPQCRWPEPPATVAGYGAARAGADATPGEDEEYLKSLRSLGYL